MKSRLLVFKQRCAEHYHYKRLAAKLSEHEFDMIVDFIDDNDELGHLEFEYAINRMFLNRERTKNWTIVQELLLLTNTATKGQQSK